MKNNVYLIGFMGCGKTTIGTNLALYQGKKFIDLDQQIVKYQNASIQELFDTYGEAHFRQLEIEQLRQTDYYHNTIVATGGGIVEREENQEFLHKHYVIYLKWSFETLYERIKNDPKRPLAKDYEVLRNRYELRQALYEKVATQIIDCEGHTPYSLAKLLTEHIK